MLKKFLGFGLFILFLGSVSFAGDCTIYVEYSPRKGMQKKMDEVFEKMTKDREIDIRTGKVQFERLPSGRHRKIEHEGKVSKIEFCLHWAESQCGMTQESVNSGIVSKAVMFSFDDQRDSTVFECTYSKGQSHLVVRTLSAPEFSEKRKAQVNNSSPGPKDAARPFPSSHEERNSCEGRACSGNTHKAE